MIDAGDDNVYAVHLQEASHWQLVGFAVVGRGKGLVVDGGGSNVLDSLSVGETADEAVHFRSSSSDNAIQHVITEPETSGCGKLVEGNRVEGFEPTGELVAVDGKCG